FVLTCRPSIGRGWLKAWLGILREGVIAGIEAGVVVALWFLVYYLAMAQAFRTPALLGAAIFTGLRKASALDITPALVIGYTIIHFIAFIAFGLAAALIIEASEREPIILLGVLMLFVCFEVIFFGIVTLADS